MGIFTERIKDLKELTKNPQARSSREAKTKCEELNFILDRGLSFGRVIERYTKQDLIDEKEYQDLVFKGRDIRSKFCILGNHYTDKDILDDIKEFKRLGIWEDYSYMADNEKSAELDPKSHFSPCKEMRNRIKYYKELRDKMYNSGRYHYDYKNKNEVIKKKDYLNQSDSDLTWKTERLTQIACSTTSTNDEKIEAVKAFNKMFDLGSDENSDNIEVSLDGLRRRKPVKKRKVKSKTKSKSKSKRRAYNRR